MSRGYLRFTTNQLAISLKCPPALLSCNMPPSNFTTSYRTYPRNRCDILPAFPINNVISHHRLRQPTCRFQCELVLQPPQPVRVNVPPTNKTNTSRVQPASDDDGSEDALVPEMSPMCGQPRLQKPIHPLPSLKEHHHLPTNLY